METIVKNTVQELAKKTAPQLREMLNGFGINSGISRTKRVDLMKMVITEQRKLAVAELPTKPMPVAEATTPEVKVNKSDLLRREIRRRARAGETLNSGDLMKFMTETHGITMSRQFVVNVRNRFLRANPELLKA